MIRTLPATASGVFQRLPTDGVSELGDGLLRSLEVLGVGIAVLTPTGRLHWSNASFRRMLASYCRCEANLVMPTDEGEIAAFRRFLTGGREAERILRLGSEKRHLYLTKLHAESVGAGLAYVAASESGWNPRMDLLRVMFRLTPAECRIVQDIAAGSSPNEVARIRALSLHTVRTHLRSVMAKIGVANRTGLLGALAPLGVLLEEQ
jgi:DNA-binding CsgD family transcriptional regulator